MTGNWFAGFSTSSIKPIDFKHFRAINLTFCVYYDPGHLLETQRLVYQGRLVSLGNSCLGIFVFQISSNLNGSNRKS